MAHSPKSATGLQWDIHKYLVLCSFNLWICGESCFGSTCSIIGPGFSNEKYKTMDIGRAASSTTFLLKINQILGNTKYYNMSNIRHIYTLLISK